MAGEINWGIIDPSMPGKVANSFYQGQQNALADTQALRANKLADLQLQNAQQEQSDRNALRGLNSAAPDYTQQVSRINPKLGMELSKMQQEQRTAKLTQAKTALELMDGLSSHVMVNPTPENAKSALAKFSQTTGADVAADLDSIDKMQGDPEKIRKWAVGHKLKANEYLPKFQHFDQGGSVVTGSVDPLTGQFSQGQAFQKVATPDALLSAKTARRGQDMADARARETQAQGKIPPGYRQKADGALEAIPGGPADAKSGAEAVKREKQLESGVNKAEIVIGKVDEALKGTGFLTSGFTGKALSNVPGTNAYDLDRTIDTIKANIGFQELQAMRESSPTGGALGQVAVRELDFLQSVLASLDVGQSEAQQIKNLKAVKTHYENWKNAVKKSGSGSGTQKPESDQKPTVSNW